MNSLLSAKAPFARSCQRCRDPRCCRLYPPLYQPRPPPASPDAARCRRRRYCARSSASLRACCAAFERQKCQRYAALCCRSVAVQRYRRTRALCRAERRVCRVNRVATQRRFLLMLGVIKRACVKDALRGTKQSAEASLRTRARGNSVYTAAPCFSRAAPPPFSCAFLLRAARRPRPSRLLLMLMRAARAILFAGQRARYARRLILQQTFSAARYEERVTCARTTRLPADAPGCQHAARYAGARFIALTIRGDFCSAMPQPPEFKRAPRGVRWKA